MAKPQILQQLTHDKLLTKANFPQFVETFNYTVNRCQNIKGDDDFVGRRGLINVDNTDPEHPIIRCNYDNLPEMVGDVLPDAELDPEAYLSAGVEGLSSIQYRTLASADTDTPGKVLELFGFDNPMTSAPLSDDSFVVRRDDSRVSYVSMSALLSAVSSSISGGGGSTPADADVPEARLSSIQTRELTGDGGKVLELYQFETPNIETVYLSAQNRYDFVMRDKTDHCVKYANLSGVGTTLSGTDGSSHYGHEFKFQSANDSNIVVNVDANGVITIGAYYL